MFNPKRFKTLATFALSLSLIGLSFGCQESQEQNNPKTTSHPTNKVELAQNGSDGVGFIEYNNAT